MSVLLNLPLDLGTTVVSEWLIANGTAVRGLVRLDTAVCSKKSRIQLLDIFSRLTYNPSLSPFLILQRVGKDLEDAFTWMKMRQVHMRRVVLRWDSNATERAVSHWYPEMEELRFNDSCSVNFMLHMVYLCPLLTELACKSALIVAMTPQKIHVLTRIHIKDNCSNEALTLISVNCTRLKSLVVESDSPVIVQVLAANPVLEHFHYTGPSEGLLECIATHCTRLKELYLVHRNLDTSALLRALRSCTQLVAFRYYGSIEWTRKASRLAVREFGESGYMAPLLQHFSGLLSLDLSRIPFGFENALPSLLSSSGSSLRSLLVRRCPGFSVGILKQVVVKCGQLRDLTLSDMNHIAVTELSTVFESGVGETECGLAKLNINDTELTRACVIRVLTACPDLEDAFFSSVDRSTGGEGDHEVLSALEGRPSRATGVKLKCVIQWKKQPPVLPRHSFGGPEEY